jgi:hypothetical protein
MATKSFSDYSVRRVVEKKEINNKLKYNKDMLSNTLQAKPYYNIREKGNDYHVNFYLRVKGRFESFANSFGTLPTLLQGQLTCFNNAVAAEDDFFKVTTASELTGTIKEWDVKRDNNTSSLRAMAEAYAMNPGDAAKQQAGKKVIDMMRHFKLNINDNYELQGSRTLQFCQAVDADSTAQQAIAAVGATVFYTALKEANEQCRAFIDQRNADRAAASQEKMINLRRATDNEYAHLLMITNAYALTDEQQRYNTLLQQIIEDVNYYEKVIFAGSGSTANNGGSGTGDNPSGTDTPGTDTPGTDTPGTDTPGTGGTGTITPGGGSDPEPDPSDNPGGMDEN